MSADELDEIEARLRAVGERNCADGSTCNNFDSALFDKAADTIRSLREQVREAKVALEPFGRASGFGSMLADERLAETVNIKGLKIKDFRRARTVYSKLGE